jgi:hypothetical protein
MNLKTGIFSLALGTLLLGSTAMADDNQFQPQWNDNGTTVQAQGYYRHGQPPPAPRNQQGRYELRTVQQWVPGRYEQVWVPQQCNYKPRWGTTKCRGGYYDQRWVEGRYQNVEQWVWVPSRWHRSSGPEWNSSPASYNY